MITVAAMAGPTRLLDTRIKEEEHLSYFYGPVHLAAQALIDALTYEQPCNV